MSYPIIKAHIFHVDLGGENNLFATSHIWLIHHFSCSVNFEDGLIAFSCFLGCAWKCSSGHSFIVNKIYLSRISVIITWLYIVINRMLAQRQTIWMESNRHNTAITEHSKELMGKKSSAALSCPAQIWKAVAKMIEIQLLLFLTEWKVHWNYSAAF